MDRTISIAISLIIMFVAHANAQLLSPSPARSGTRPRPTPQQVREEFERIERIARLAPEQRVRQLTLLYTENFVTLSESVLVEQFASSSFPPQRLLVVDRNPGPTVAYSAELDSVAQTMSPEQVAQAILANYNSNILHLASLVRLKFIFMEHRLELERLIEADLRGDDTAAYRGFLAIREMRLEEFVNRMMGMILEGGPRADQAVQSLGWMRSNPAAARPLIDDLAKNPGNAPRYQPLLRLLLSDQPVDPTIIKLLDSQDDSIRGAAAMILEEAPNATAVDLIPQLLLDPALPVRLSALRKAFRLTPDLFLRVREYIVGRLKSDVLEERVQAATGLAQKQDGAGARVLLDALKDQNVPTGLRVQVSTAATNLMNPAGMRSGGTYVRILPNAWDQSNPQAAESVAAFEKWVREHPDAVK